MNAQQRPVLVVGAGPAGLTAAIALARQGVATLIVERRPELSGLPRATVISTRSMEIFRLWGLEDRILAGGVDVEWLPWMCRTLAEAAAGSPYAVGYPTRDQSAVLSPTGPACVPQDHLEPVLLEHLRSWPAAAVELGVEVVDVTDGADEVLVVLRDVATGVTRVQPAAHVVAADGAHSGSSASSAPVRAWPTSPCGWSGWVPSRSPRRSPSGSGRVASSSSATPPTGSLRAEAPG